MLSSQEEVLEKNAAKCQLQLRDTWKILLFLVILNQASSREVNSDN